MRHIAMGLALTIPVDCSKTQRLYSEASLDI